MKRFSWLAALAALALFGDTRAPAAEELVPNLQVVSVSPGLGGRQRFNCVIPVAVELQAARTPVSGRITVASGAGASSNATYVVPFDVSPGAPYLYFVYVYNSGANYQLTIADSARKTARHETLVMQNTEREKYFVASIGPEGIPGLRAEPDANGLGLVNSPIPMPLLPQEACGWEAADVVLWAHPDPSRVTPAQEKALTDWVLGGGRLVIAVGDSWEAVSKTFLADFVPGRVTGVTTTQSLDAVAGLGGTDFDPGSEMVIATLEGSVGDNVAAAGDAPLVVRKRYGFGEVIFLAFDPTKSPFARWRGNTGFWLGLFDLRRSAQDEGYYGGRYGTSMSDAVARALNAFPEVQPIAFGFVVAFLGAYVILIGPVDYLVLKRLKHLEWTWFTFPAIALAATLTAFAMISFSRKARIYVNQVSVVDWSADARSRRSFETAVLLSPTHHRYDVSFPPPAGGLHLVESGSLGMQPGFNIASSDFTLAERGEERRLTAENLLIPVWSTRTFAARSRAGDAAGAPLEAALAQDGATLAGSVTNTGITTLNNILVLHKSGAYQFGEALRPGESIDMSKARRTAFAAWCRQAAGRASSAGSSRLARLEALEVMRLATVENDSRFHPTLWSENRQDQGNEFWQFDLPPEASLRAAVDAGEAVVVAAGEGAAGELDIGTSGATRWAASVYRVCVNVQ